MVLSPARPPSVPKGLDDQPAMRHRTGSPYRTAAEVRQAGATRLGCGTPGRQWDAILLKLLARYGDATDATDADDADDQNGEQRRETD